MRICRAAHGHDDGGRVPSDSGLGGGAGGGIGGGTGESGDGDGGGAFAALAGLLASVSGALGCTASRAAWKLRLTFALSLTTVYLSLFAICYAWCGAAFYREALLHHITRADARHNFSPYFYALYLAPKGTLLRGLLSSLAFVPQAALLLALAARFGRDLPFCMFAQTLVFVSFKKVCTAQYFVWYHGLLPLVLPSTAAPCASSARARSSQPPCGPPACCCGSASRTSSSFARATPSCRCGSPGCSSSSPMSTWCTRRSGCTTPRRSSAAGACAAGLPLRCRGDRGGGHGGRTAPRGWRSLRQPGRYDDTRDS